MSFGKKKLEKVIQQIINSTRQSYNAYLFKGCKRNSFLIASFITAFLISSLALTGILSNNLSQGTEKVSAAMILTASATSEGGGGDHRQGEAMETKEEAMATKEEIKMIQVTIQVMIKTEAMEMPIFNLTLIQNQTEPLRQLNLNLLQN